MFDSIMNVINNFSIPFIILAFVAFGLYKKVNVYESFTTGAKEGFTTAVNIIPFLVGMLMAIGIFRASGAMELLIKIISPVTSKLGVPSEVIPMALIRPLSGGGAQGMMTDLVTTHGAQSMIGRISAVMMGSTETTFYVLAVYFGSIGVTKQRHAIPVGLLADLAGLTMSIIVVKILF